MTSIATLGFSPGAIKNIVWFGFGGSDGAPEPPPAAEGVSGGWLSPEQARAVLRKIHRRRADKARRAEELQAAIEAAERAEEAGEPDPIAPVREIVERDTGAILMTLGTLQDALEQLAWIDQQIAAVNQRRMDDAAAILLLTEI